MKTRRREFLWQISGVTALAASGSLLARDTQAVRADNEGCRGDKRTFEVLSRSSTRIGSVPVFADEALGIRVVHGFRKGALAFVVMAVSQIPKTSLSPRKSRVRWT